MSRIVLALLLLIGWSAYSPPAAAIDGYACAGNVAQPGCDQGKAYADCRTALADKLAANPGWTVVENCPLNNPTLPEPFYSCKVRDTVNFNDKNCGQNSLVGGSGAAYAFPFVKEQNCLARPALGNQVVEVSDPNAYQSCSSGCEFIDNDSTTESYTANGKTYVRVNGWIATGDTCTGTPDPVDPPDPDDTDGDGVPDYLDDFPADPNESNDADGDGIGDNADFSPDDPDDGQDTPGEEDGDDEGDNQASGGGTCDAPPQCSGDGIQCAQLYQQWRIHCNTKKTTVSGSPEVCGASYTCSGDSAQCAQIALLRKNACDGAVSGPGGDADGDGQPDWTEGSAPAPGDDGGDDDVTEWGLGISPDLLDSENIFGSGSCPTFEPISIMGVQFDPSEFTWWCTLVSVLRACILIFGAFTALRILMGDW